MRISKSNDMMLQEQLGHFGATGFLRYGAGLSQVYLGLELIIAHGSIWSLVCQIGPVNTSSADRCSTKRLCCGTSSQRRAAEGRVALWCIVVLVFTVQRCCGQGQIRPRALGTEPADPLGGSVTVDETREDSS